MRTRGNDFKKNLMMGGEGKVNVELRGERRPRLKERTFKKKRSSKRKPPSKSAIFFRQKTGDGQKYKKKTKNSQGRSSLSLGSAKKKNP